MASQGRLLHCSRMVPSPVIPLLPLPCHIAAVQQGCPGTEGTLLRMTFLPSFYMLLCPSTSNYHHPVHIKTWLKPVIEINSLDLLQLSNTWQNQMPTVLIYTREECHLEIILHIHLSLLMANPNARPRRIFMWPHTNSAILS